MKIEVNYKVRDTHKDCVEGERKKIICGTLDMAKAILGDIQRFINTKGYISTYDFYKISGYSKEEMPSDASFNIGWTDVDTASIHLNRDFFYELRMPELGQKEEIEETGKCTNMYDAIIAVVNSDLSDCRKQEIIEHICK